jgi:hypothetical protein
MFYKCIYTLTDNFIPSVYGVRTVYATCKEHATIMCIRFLRCRKSNKNKQIEVINIREA